MAWPNQALHLTGAAILVSRDTKVLQAAPAGELGCSPHRGKLSAVPRRKEDADVLTRSGLIVGLIVVMVLFLAANPRAEDWREIIGTPGLSYDPGSAVYDAKKDHVYVRTKPRGMKPRWDSFSCSRYAWWMSFDDGNTWTGERPMEPGAFNDFREMLCAKKRSLPVYEGR